jgi:hypothetical protein
MPASTRAEDNAMNVYATYVNNEINKLYNNGEKPEPWQPLLPALEAARKRKRNKARRIR